MVGSVGKLVPGTSVELMVGMLLVVRSVVCGLVTVVTLLVVRCSNCGLVVDVGLGWSCAVMLFVEGMYGVGGDVVPSFLRTQEL